MARWQQGGLSLETHLRPLQEGKNSEVSIYTLPYFSPLSLSSKTAYVHLGMLTAGSFFVVLFHTVKLSV